MRAHMGVWLTISLMAVMMLTLVVTWPRPASQVRPNQNPIMTMMGAPGGPPPDGGMGGPPPGGPPPGGP